MTRIERLIDDHKTLFREAARESVVVHRALEMCRQENLNEGYAWLFAAVALVEQNREMLKIAQALINTSPLPPITSKK